MLKKKKGTSGNAVQYLTRNQALKRLQLKLSEFRRLCILKGVHPREPKKKPQGQNKTYYHVKDIAYLLHEPLLKKARELAAYEKKVRRATAKKNRDLAQRLADRRPTYRLDHLVRERYPSFVDALRDLDDPLTMVHLFAVLPAEKAHGIPAPVVALARRLALEWQAWVVRAAALRKAFISVKGYYYQAEVQGQVVTWLVPHATSQVLPPDVDYKVMLTFLEFYQTLLKFVNFKLYHAQGLRYPPVLDSKLEAAAAGLEALMKDLAHSGGAAGAAPAAALPAAAAGGEQREVNPAAEQRIGSLADKVRELEAEIRSERPREAAPQAQQAQQQEAAADEEDEGDEDYEIDSGDEGADSDDDDEEEEEEGGSDDEAEEQQIEAAAADPTDAELAGAAGGASSDDEGMDAGEEDGDRLAGGAADVDADDDAAVCAALFKGLVFFLGREVPREQLLLVVRAFGGEAGWAGEGSPFEEADERITHQVVDRPQQDRSVASREYVQPQWVFDSANFRVLAKPSLYAPGKQLPPHLSPFVNADEEGYVPEYGQQLAALQEAARAARRRRAAAALGGDVFVGEEAEGGDGAGAGGVALTAAEELEAAEARYAAELAKELKKTSAAAAGQEAAEEQSARPSKKRSAEADLAADEADMKDIMMTRKNKKMYQGLKKREAEKAARVAALEEKAAALKSGGGAKPKPSKRAR